MTGIILYIVAFIVSNFRTHSPVEFVGDLQGMIGQLMFFASGWIASKDFYNWQERRRNDKN